MINVLFLCTGNSARSIMAETILNRLGEGRFRAYSAGSKPTGVVNPYAVAMLKVLGYDDVAHTRSKSWDEFTTPSAPEVDLVITLCDQAAGETCPSWVGEPITVHWSLPDPAYHPGSDEERIEFAQRVAERLRLKIKGLAKIDFSASRGDVSERLAFLGEI